MGVVGAIAEVAGAKSAWMGGYVALCTAAIMFYYSVISGWCIKYLCLSLGGALTDLTHVQAVERFGRFTSGVQPVVFRFLAIGIVCFIACRGVVGGIEKAAKVLVPTLYCLLIVAAVRALFLPRCGEALRFLFCPEWGKLADYRVWLQGLTQSAWSTGAGWGLLSACRRR